MNNYLIFAIGVIVGSILTVVIIGVRVLIKGENNGLKKWHVKR